MVVDEVAGKAGNAVGIRLVKIKTADALGGKEMTFIDTRYFLKTWLAQFAESFWVRMAFIAIIVSSFLFEGLLATVMRVALLIFVFYAYERRIVELKVPRLVEKSGVKDKEGVDEVAKPIAVNPGPDGLGS